MTEASAQNLSRASEVFTLSSIGALQKFVDGLDTSDHFEAALAFLVCTWIKEAAARGEERIEPRLLLSEDLSAAMLGQFPVIFMGSNAWATKPYQSAETHLTRIDRLFSHICDTARRFGDRPVMLAIVPEKDYIVDQYFMKTGRFAGIEAAMSHLGQRCATEGIHFTHRGYLDQLNSYETKEDFTYFDSHLPWRHYHQFFAEILKATGTDWSSVSEHYTVQNMQVFADLQTKFGETKASASAARKLFRTDEALSIAKGSESFASPLGDTWQLIRNDKPLRPDKVLILGDSHSSILSMHNLTYLLASCFAQCQFHWNPMAIREAPPETDADVILMEISQRFLL